MLSVTPSHPYGFALAASPVRGMDHLIKGKSPWDLGGRGGAVLSGLILTGYSVPSSSSTNGCEMMADFIRRQIPRSHASF